MERVVNTLVRAKPASSSLGVISSVLASDSRPTLIVDGTTIVLANAAARRMFQRDVVGSDISKLGVWRDGSLEDFIELARSTRQAAPGSIFLSHDGQATRVGLTGALLERTPSGANRIILRFNQGPVSRFGVLSDKVRQLNEEIGHRRRIETLLNTALSNFKGVFDNAAVGIALVGYDGAFRDANQRLCEILGYAQQDLLLKTFQEITAPEDLATDLAHLEKVKSGEISHYQIEKRYLRGDGEMIWARLSVGVAHQSGNRPNMFVAVVEDVSKEKQSEIARDILISELNHRVKNILAVIQGIVHQTALLTPDRGDFTKAIEARLHSIARAHDFLNTNNWTSLTLKNLIELNKRGVFEPYADRISCAGDDVKLPLDTTVIFTLILHELLTNAIKHGALSNDRGAVSILTRVSRSADRSRLSLFWKETNGPPVKAVHSAGFGSFLLKRGVAFSLEGTSNIELEPDGLKFSMEIPLGSEENALALN